MRPLAIGRMAAAAWVSMQAGESLAADPGAGAGRFTATLERPLFSPTRRPPPPPPPSAVMVALPNAAIVVPPAPPPDVALSGVIIGGHGGVALLRRPQDAAAVRVTLGGQIDGWTLAEIHPRDIVLSRDERRVTVKLPAAPP